ncbi:MAG: polysaccharide biosynthesis tyrosine autokinase [Cytophagaceae bacterium]
MQQNSTPSDFSANETVDFKKYWNILKKFWYVPILFFLISLSVAYYKVRFAISQYVVSTSIQIKDKSTYTYGSQNFLQGMNLFSAVKNIQNELEVVKSFDVIETAVKELNEPYTYYHVGDINDYEFYQDSPIKITYDSSFILVNTKFQVTVLSNDAYSLTLQSGSYKPYDNIRHVYIDTLLPSISIVNKEYRFGEKILLPLCSFSIEKSFPYSPYKKGDVYYAIGRDLEYRAYEGKGMMSASITNEDASIIQVSVRGPVIQKSVDLANKVIEVYIRKELEDKNQIASNTVDFIDIQLNRISDSLHYAENSLQRFKSNNKVYNIDQTAEVTYSKMVELERKKSDLDLQNKYYQYLKNYVTSDRPFSDVVAPTTVNITDPLLTKLVAELVALYQEKNAMMYTTSDKSPAYQTLLLRIKSSKEALLENVENINRSSQIAINDIDARIRENETKLRALPAQERDFINIQRRFALNDNIYNYLLQKRAEASIAKASNTSDAKIIERAKKKEAFKIYPKPNNTYSIALFVGLFLTALFVFIVSLLRVKVESKEDVSRFTNVPVLGNISFLKDKPEHLGKVYQLDRGFLESFRSIRVNLQYYLKDKASSVIGVTSCISGDGKTFTSYNLAKIYALSEKKTLLICADMRKPMDTSDYGVEEVKLGLSNFLIKQATLSEVATPTEDSYLSIIFPGGVPPNASELMASSRMETLIKEASKEYEIIIIDSPPVGLVSDYLTLMKLVDVNLYVVRLNYTPKKILSIIQEVKDNHPEAQHALILNGIKSGGHYGYGYGYGYGVSIKKKWWKLF